MENKVNIKGLIIKIILAILFVGLLAYGLYAGYQRSSRFVYTDHLLDAAIYVDGDPITFEDLSFYVLYEEKEIEDQANVYNPDNTRDYWNTHVNGEFVSVAAKNAMASMAVHDYIFYNLAKDNYLVLSSDEKKSIENSKEDFWMDLYDCQLENLPSTKENIDETIERIAYAQKYQNRLTEEEGLNSYAYDYDGYEYEQMLKSHEIKYNEKLWKKFTLGNVTLVHNKVNFINGFSDEDIENKKNQGRKGFFERFNNED